ncbi:MAG: hypothetical protein Q8Q87_04880 [Candidatus Omnitrophota bacterium]|nr:hypothetical protein [Candidatus Omnitrophota bacterium]
MVEELKGLIEKIQEDGVRAAEEKANKIEAEARKKAEAIIEKARTDADSMIARAREEIGRMEEGSRASLKQAGRDLLISLKKEVNSLLGRLILSEVKHALAPEELAKIIIALIKGFAEREASKVIISLKKEDMESVEKHLFRELSAELKKGITLAASEEIRGGFLISYDSGKSYFDFTDRALAGYISLQLKPRLAEILKESAEGGKKGKL